MVDSIPMSRRESCFVATTWCPPRRIAFDHVALSLYRHVHVLVLPGTHGRTLKIAVPCRLGHSRVSALNSGATPLSSKVGDCGSSRVRASAPLVCSLVFGGMGAAHVSPSCPVVHPEAATPWHPRITSLSLLRFCGGFRVCLAQNALNSCPAPLVLGLCYGPHL